VLGGGYTAFFVEETGRPEIMTWENAPLPGQSGWRVGIKNYSTDEVLLTVYALCASIG
jgi:hypothetical protein